MPLVIERNPPHQAKDIGVALNSGTRFLVFNQRTSSRMGEIPVLDDPAALVKYIEAAMQEAFEAGYEAHAADARKVLGIR